MLSQHVGHQSSILQQWHPDWLPQLFDDVNKLTVQKDVGQRPLTLAEEISTFRSKVDESFGWNGKVLDEQQRCRRAAAQTTATRLFGAVSFCIFSPLTSITKPAHSMLTFCLLSEVVALVMCRGVDTLNFHARNQKDKDIDCVCTLSCLAQRYLCSFTVTQPRYQDC